MKARNGGASRGKGRRRSNAEGPGSATDALREEAERGWAAEDRKSAKALRRGAAKRGKRTGGSATER
jgi:hypothetical protein